MINRKSSVYRGTELLEVTYRDVEWAELRRVRDSELKATDHWALKDRTMSQAKKDYRVMLRDLPSDFEGENANQACDHWVDNPRPEE
jgi:hypothetical protein